MLKKTFNKNLNNCFPQWWKYLQKRLMFICSLATVWSLFFHSTNLDKKIKALPYWQCQNFIFIVWFSLVTRLWTSTTGTENAWEDYDINMIYLWFMYDLSMTKYNLIAIKYEININKYNLNMIKYQQFRKSQKHPFFASFTCKIFESIPLLCFTRCNVDICNISF